MRQIFAVVALAGALALTGCSQEATTDKTLTEVTHSQFKSVPDWDSSEQVETDATRLAALQALIEKYNWDGTQDDALDGCTGGTSTELQLEWSDGTTDQWSTYRCGQGNDEFVVEMTDLVGSWR